MSEPPAVSVIVLGYNGRRYVDACLRSLLDQDFDRPYEVLFVDNGSVDGTAEAAASFDAVKLHRLDRNYGYCQGNNKASVLAQAPLMVFLNQDVVVHRHWLSELVAAAGSSPEIKAVQASVVHPWNREFAAKERTGPLSVAYAPELSRLGFVEYRSLPADQPTVDTLFVSGVSLLLKRDVIDEIGGYVFDPDMFAYGEDVDLSLRIRGAGYRTVVATRAVVYHDHTLGDRMSLGSFLKTVRIIRNRLLAFWKNSGWLEFAPLATIIVAGSAFNSRQFGLAPLRTALYFLLLIPPTLVAPIAAVIVMPRYAGRRRQTLRARRRRPGWLVRTLVFDRGGLSRDLLEHPVLTGIGS